MSFLPRTRSRLQKAAKSFSSKTPFDESSSPTSTPSHADSQSSSLSVSSHRVSQDDPVAELDLSVHKDSLRQNKEELEDILKDSPSIREQFRQKEIELDNIEKNLRKIVKLAKQLQAAGDAFRTISDSFGQELMRFDFTNLPSDLEKNFATATSKLGETVLDMGEYHSIFMVQLASVFTHPLEQLLREDIKSSKEICKQHSRLRTKYDQTVSKYSHIKKTEIDKTHEAEHELYYIRKEFQHSSLDYASKLRRVQTLSNIQLMECACSFVSSQKTFFHQGNEIHIAAEPNIKSVSRYVALGRKYIELHDSILKRRKDELILHGTDDLNSSKELKGETTGYLFAKGSSKWKRGYYSIISNNFVKIGKDNSQTILFNLLLTTIRPARDVDRRFCFEIVSPSDTFIFQAENEVQCNHWISVVQNAIASALNNSAPNALKQQNSSKTENIELRNRLLETDPHNGFCADCGAKDPEWASINLGILICIKCSGIHRQIGTHISKVRSLTLDSWDKELRVLMLALGNTKVNEFYEYNLKPEAKINEESSSELRTAFIKDKYEKKSFLLSLEVPSKERNLANCVRNNDIVGSLHLLALGANPNWKDTTNADLTCTHLAIMSGNLAICDLIIQNGGNINVQDSELRAPIHHAVLLDNVSGLILLIRRGAKLTLRDATNKAPLDLAIEHFRAHCVTLLRLALHAESEHPGNALEDESFAFALKEFSDEVENSLTQNPA